MAGATFTPGQPSETETGSAAVELRAATVRYQGTLALKGIDLAVEKSEFFSLLGPSGCGKTTSLNVIGGFVRLDSGRLYINGESMESVPPHRRPVNTVFQSYALFPHMTIAENVGFGPRMMGVESAEIARRVGEALELVSLDGFSERRPNQLSGGQQQRVALARALINHPSVLLLDEPLGALDLQLRRQMQLELSRIQREVGITFIYVTHDQEEAMTMSDRLAVMERGAIAQIGTPREVYENPASLFVADFIGSSNILRGQIINVEPQATAIRIDDGTLIKARATPGARVGEQVRVVVRPDHLRLLQDDSDAGTNRLSGIVTKVSFLGTHLLMTARMRSGAELAVTCDASAELPQSLEVGSEITVSWPLERSLCFPERQAEEVAA